MYQYIYDSFLSDERYSKILSMLEIRLTDLGLQGRVSRLNLFKDPREIICEGLKIGVQTVVAVGNDATLNQVVNAVGDLKLVVGMIPVGPKNEIAKVLGIGEGLPACDCLSSRLIQKIDLGKINDHYFLSHLRASSKIHLRCGGQYCVKLVKEGRVEIYNLPTFQESANPQDGYLEAKIKPAGRNLLVKKFSGEGSSGSGVSFFPFKKIFLESGEAAPVLVDNFKVVNTPAEVQIFPQRLKMIVGKNRLF
jgi:diacylglycerol kinase family enzyme